MSGRPQATARRLGWFVALYAAGVLTTGIVAYGLRALLFAR